MATRFFVPMKISDLKGYEMPKNNSVRFFSIGRKKSAPIFKIFLQSLIDFTLSNIIRIIVGLLTFKFLMRNTPVEELKTMQTGEQVSAFLIEHNVVLYGIVSLAIALFVGSFYYIILIAYTEKGTVGSWAANLRFQAKGGERPGLFRVAVWYIVKALYPIFAISCVAGIIIFKGVNAPVLILFALTAAFSNIPSLMFGVRTPAEIFSSIKVVEYRK